MILKGVALLILFQSTVSKKKPEYVTPPESWGQDKIEFRLYTRAKQWGYNLISYNGPVVRPEEFTEETDENVVSWESTGLDPSKRTVFTIHGLGGMDFGNAYAAAFRTTGADVNLISIYWKKVWYKFSKRPDMRMAHIGGVAGHFLNDLIDQSGLSLENVHVIGFSYGGQVPKKRYQLDTLRCLLQVGSNMCKKFQELTGEKVPRFTALDPGSIGFSKPQQLKVRNSALYTKHTLLQHAVNKKDARLVDVIHTSADIGTPAPAGHLDFYPNGGDLRKGHKKAVAFYEQTILGKEYATWNCHASYDNFLKAGRSCMASQGEEMLMMGEQLDVKGKLEEGIYYTVAEDPGKFTFCTPKACPPA